MFNVASRTALIALLAAALTAGPAHAELSPEAMKIAEANFKKANASGTGALTADEFKTFIDLNAAASIGKAARIKSYNAYAKAFSGVDTDKNGAITWEEYVAAQSR